MIFPDAPVADRARRVRYPLAIPAPTATITLTKNRSSWVPSRLLGLWWRDLRAQWSRGDGTREGGGKMELIWRGGKKCSRLRQGHGGICCQVRNLSKIFSSREIFLSRLTLDRSAASGDSDG
jgi:hypothetical protein